MGRLLRRALLVCLSWGASATFGQHSVSFEEAASEAGLRFTLDHSPTSEKRMIETMAGGLAVFDYDSDGRPDVFFTSGAAVPSLEKTGPRFWNRLFRNTGGGRFEDVTEKAGAAGAGYSMGAAAGDFDNDGRPDLFVAGVFRNLLYRNRGDGTFEDVTARSGVKGDRWSVAAGWFDYDNDRDLDLLVVNYADWTIDDDRYCGDRDRNVRVYCHPKYFKPIANQLYRNRGDGSFEDVSEVSGIAAFEGRGMSVAFADYDADGWTDAFVTNDNLPNFLFRNNGDGTFTEDALLAGVALLEHGKPVASMGADFRDFDNDSRPDLSVTALSGETFPLFRNEGDGLFTDATHASRLARAAAPYAGWGNLFADFDNDGWKDLFTANAHVNDRVELFEPYEYAQPNAVFLNRGGSFEEAVELGPRAAHRGAGVADFDGDGRLDAVVSVLGGPAELWLNRTQPAGSWIAFRLEGPASALGACITLGQQTNCRTSSAGYASSSLIDVHFGLGSQEKIPQASIRWPSGAVEVLNDLRANRTVTVRAP